MYAWSTTFLELQILLFNYQLSAMRAALTNPVDVLKNE